MWIRGSQTASASGCYHQVFRALNVGLFFLFTVDTKGSDSSSAAVIMNTDRRCVCFRLPRSSSACCVSCSVWLLPTRRLCCSTLRSVSESLYVNFTPSHKEQLTDWCVSALWGDATEDNQHVSLLSCSSCSPALWRWRQSDGLQSDWWVFWSVLLLESHTETFLNIHCELLFSVSAPQVFVLVSLLRRDIVWMMFRTGLSQ